MDVDKESTQPTELGELAWPELDLDRDETGLDSGYVPRSSAARPETGVER
jgi:hypothetical protein